MPDGRSRQLHPGRPPETDPEARPLAEGLLAPRVAPTPRGPVELTVTVPADVILAFESTVAQRIARPSAPPSIRPAARTTLTAEHPGRYQRGRELGRGGMGQVVAAMDDHLGREVAMKELHPSAGGLDVGALLRFVREARVTGQLEHPGIVPVHELGRRDDGTFYYTMKRIRGRSLADALAEATTPEARLRLIGAFRAVCETLAYAHSRGVVHRDLKPANVMVGEFNETLVVDWGLAKVRGAPDAEVRDLREPRDEPRGDAAETLAGHAIGTPSYMSPEQARGDLELIDERSDVWGLGAILFEILTGRPPLTGATVIEVLGAALESRVERVRALAPSAPAELAAIADRALSADRSARYASARDLATEIAAWQDGGRVVAYDYSSMELVRRFVRRNRAATFAGVAILAAVTAAVGAISFSYADALDAREAAEVRALIAEAGRLDQLGHRPQAFALLRAADALGGRDYAPDLARAGFFAHADEPQPIVFGGDGGLAQDGRLFADGRRALTCANDGRVREWDVATGTLLRTLVSPGGANALAISGDERRFVTGSNDEVTLWDLAAGTIVRRLPCTGDRLSLALSSDGRRALTGHRDGTARLWDLESGEERTLTHYAEWVRGVAFSPDAQRVATGAGDGTLRVISTDTGATVLDLPSLGSEVRSIGWSPDGSRLAIALQSGELRVVDASDGTTRVSVAAHGAPATAVAWSSDSLKIATASEDAHARVWSATSGALLFDLSHRGRLNSIGFDRGGARLITTELDDEAVLVWSVPARAGMVLRGHEEWVHDATFSPSGEEIASASRDGTIRLWDGSSGLERQVLRAEGGSVYCVRYSPNGRRIASGSRDGHVRVWDIATGTITVDIIGHTDPVYDVAFIDDERLLSVSVDRSVRIWSATDGSALWTRTGSEILNSVATAAGYAATGGSAGTIELWRLDEPDHVTVLHGHHTPQGIYGLAFANDGSVFASASIEGSVVLWEPSTGRRLREIASLERGVTSIGFSPDGSRLVGGCEDSVVRVWDTRTGQLITTYSGHEHNVRGAAFSPTGDRIVSAAADETVRVWRTAREDIAEAVRTSSGLTNLRVCRSGFAVVAVPLGPDLDPIWAPPAACATPRSTER